MGNTNILGYTREEEEDPFYSIIVWHGEALNPLNFLNPYKYRTKRQLSQRLYVGGAATVAGHIVGGSLLSTMSGQAPNLLRMQALGLHSKIEAGKHAVHTMGFIARNAIPAISAAAVGYAIVSVGDAFLRHITGGMAGILPDADFMNWHG